MFDYFFFFQLAALLICVILYRSLGQSIYQWFLPYLVIMSLYEYGTFNGWFTINKSNHWSFNIVSTSEFIFYGFVLNKLLFSGKAKSIVTVAFGLTFIVTILNISFIQGFWPLHTYSYLLQSVVIIAADCIFLYQLMQVVPSKIPLYSNPDFWLSTGILFYYLGSFMFFATFNHLAYKGNRSYSILYSVIYNFYNIILYACLIKSFLCFKKTRTQSYL